MRKGQEQISRTGPGARLPKLAACLAGLIFLAIAIAACGGSSDGGSDGGSNGAEEAAAGDSTLIVAIPGTPQGIDADQQSGPQTWSMQGQTGVGGFRYRRIDYPFESASSLASLNQVPGLTYADLDLTNLDNGVLESCELTKGGRVATWKLREGVMSAHGNELTSADVIWGVERSAANQALGAFFNLNAGAPDPKQWKAVDDYTLRITADQPMPAICTFPAHYFFAFKFIDSTEAKKHATDEDPWANEWLSSNDASFGPYTVTSWQADKEVVMEVNPNYYGEEPSIKKIIWRVVPDVSARVALLKSGDVDVAENLGPEEIASLDGDPNVQIASLKNSLQMFIEMNNTKPPFDDVKVRRAMNMAIPRDQIVESVFHGLATPWEGVNSTIYPGFVELNNYPYDLDQAKALLEDAGYGDGFPLELAYSAGDPAQEQIGVILRDTFSQLGIDLKLQKLPPAALADLVQSGKSEFAMWVDAPFHPEPSFALSLWYQSNSCCNWQNYNNPKVDAALAECAAVVDVQERIDCHEPIQQMISEDAPLVWVVQPDFSVGLSKRVSGWGTDPNQFYPIELMSVE